MTLVAMMWNLSAWLINHKIQIPAECNYRQPVLEITEYVMSVAYRSRSHHSGFNHYTFYHKYSSATNALLSQGAKTKL